MTQVSVNSAGSAGSVESADPAEAAEAVERRGGGGGKVADHRCACSGRAADHRRADSPGRPDRAGHELGDPQAGLEPAVPPAGGHGGIRPGAAAGHAGRGDGAEPRDPAAAAAAVAPAALAPARRLLAGSPALHRGHAGLPGPGRDALGAQPGLAAQPAAPAAGQRGDRRGHGLPDPGGLVGHRQLRGLRPDRRAGRQPVHDQPARLAGDAPGYSTTSTSWAGPGGTSHRSTARWPP